MPRFDELVKATMEPGLKTLAGGRTTAPCVHVLVAILALALVRDTSAAETDALQTLNSNVLAEGESLSSMLGDDVSARLTEANRRSLAACRAVGSREDWERLRDERIAALRRSLGQFPP